MVNESSRQGQGRSRQRKHNLNSNNNLMGFDTIEINLVFLLFLLSLLSLGWSASNFDLFYNTTFSAFLGMMGG